MIYKFKHDSEIHEINVERNGDLLTIRYGEQEFQVKLTGSENGVFSFVINDRIVKGYAVRDKDVIYGRINHRNWVFEDVTADDGDVSGRAGRSSAENVVAPMPGSVIKVLVEEGQKVATHQALVIVEAMKMENEVCAPADVVIGKIHVSAGQQVAAGEVLIDFMKTDEDKDAPA